MVPEVLQGLDPRARAIVRGHIVELLGEYCIYPGHPVSLIEVCGIITEVHFQTHLTSFSVDDGTGVLPCIAWPDDGINLQDENIFSIGRCVTIQGKLSYNLNQGRHELSMRKLVINYEVNAEAKFTMEVDTLKREVYQVPWSPPQFLLNQVKEIEASLSQPQPQSEIGSTPSHPIAFLDHLATLPRSEFRLDELLSDQHLHRIIQALSPSPTEDSFDDTIRKTFHLLIQEGHLYESRPRSGSYRILDPSEFHHTILTALRQYPPFQLGANANMLRTHLTRTTAYPHFPLPCYHRALAHLEAQGLLYQSHHQYYKVVE